MTLAALGPICRPFRWSQERNTGRIIRIQYPLVEGKREPNPAQARFAKLVQEKDYVLFSGGVGSGKTTAGAYEAARLCYLNRGKAGFIVAHDWNTLRTVTLPAFLGFFPPSWIISHNKNLRCIQLRGGRTVYYGSAANPKSLEAKTIAWGWGDEIRYWPREAYEKWIARGRQRSNTTKFICTSTPAMNWIYNEFCTGKNNRGVVYCSTRENAHNLRAGYVDDLAASYSTRVLKSYVEGDFTALAGEVFDLFSRSMHLQDLWISPYVPVDVAFDPGKRKASMTFWQHFDWCDVHQVDNCDHCIGELCEDQTNTAKMLHLCGQTFDENNWIRGKMMIDPAAAGGNIERGYSTVKMCEAVGWDVEYTTDIEDRWVPYGIDLINSKFQPSNGTPTLYLDSSMERGHERGSYAMLTGSEYPEDKQGRPISDEPIKCGWLDHTRDTWRYYLVNRYPACRSEIYGMYEL